LPGTEYAEHGHRRAGRGQERLRSGQRGIEAPRQLRLRLGADDAVDLAAALEEQQRGDVHDAVLRGDARVVVDVELAELDLALVGGGELFNDRRDQPARTA